MEELYTIKEVSGMLKVSRVTLYRWIQTGKLKYYRAGKGVRIPKSSLEQFLESGGEEKR